MASGFRTFGNKLWKRCVFQRPNRASIKVSFLDLPRNRFDEFVDFHMKYYVKEELTFRISGLPNNEVAMSEYRQWFRNVISSPSCHNIVGCIEDRNENPTDIISIDTFKIINQTETCPDDISANVNHEVTKNYFKILKEWNDLCPVPELMEKYNVQRFLYGLGIAVHPEYARHGICTEIFRIRKEISPELGIEMGGDWCTSLGSYKGSARAGWKTIYEISREELEMLLNVKLNTPLPTFIYTTFKAK